MNPKKLATNATSIGTEMVKLDDTSSYKYLGITESNTSKHKKHIIDQIKLRIEKLAKTKLSGKH